MPGTKTRCCWSSQARASQIYRGQWGAAPDASPIGIARGAGRGSCSQGSSSGKEKEPELLKAVKLEPADEDWIEEAKELSSLRMCNLCNTKSYLRQGLCCNLYCQAFSMRDPHAGEKLTARGKYEHGAKWSPRDWKQHAMPRIECAQLAKAFEDSIQEYGEELQEAMLPPPQVEGAAPFIDEPVIIEDLESHDNSKIVIVMGIYWNIYVVAILVKWDVISYYLKLCIAMPLLIPCWLGLFICMIGMMDSPIVGNPWQPLHTHVAFYSHGVSSSGDVSKPILLYLGGWTSICQLFGVH